MIRRRTKYGAMRTLSQGRWFHSGLEAKRGAELALLEKAGVIRELTYQPHVELAGSVSWHGDFAYVELPSERTVIEDFKGKPDAKFVIVCQLWPLWGDVPLLVSKWERGRGFFIQREILPKPQMRLDWMLGQLGAYGR